MKKQHKYAVLYAVLYAVVISVLLICAWRSRNYIEHFSTSNLKLNDVKIFYINLDKNVARNNTFLNSYNNCDMKDLTIKRFPAILGKNVDFQEWLSPDALDQLKRTESTKTRTRHYHLTAGGVGCFLSHYNLAKQLLADNDANYYVVFEDDINFLPNTFKGINHYFPNVPGDWDILLLSSLRKINYIKVGDFYKPNGFWGTQSYIINKKGAQKLVKEVEKNKIDGQIDAYLSKMNQQKKINIYITDKNLVYINELSETTDIQCRLIPMVGENPFNYKGYIV